MARNEQELVSDNYDATEDEEEEEEEDEDLDEIKETYNDHDCKGMCGTTTWGPSRCNKWFEGKVLDPRATWVQEWNRVFLLVCATGLFVDPLFFYTLSISENCMCLFVDGWFAVTVTVLRCMTDALHVWNMWLQLKMNRRPRAVTVTGDDEGSSNSRIRSRLHDASAKTVALGYLKSKKGFFFDLFVILPLPQVCFFFSFTRNLELNICKIIG